MYRPFALRVLLAVLMPAAVLWGQEIKPGKNTIVLRGRAQEVHYHPAAGAKAGALLFLPGDGGWRGFAIDIANGASSRGYDVFGWDSRVYLGSFTSGKATLTETQVAADFLAMAGVLAQGKPGKMLVGGWSEGAGLALVGAAAKENREVFGGLLTIGLPERGFLAWRLADAITYLTRREPSEPSFESAPLLARVSPLPLAMIQSTGDEYVNPDLARKMFARAAEPKRFLLIEAKNHRFDGNQAEFFRTLQQALEWRRTSK